MIDMDLEREDGYASAAQTAHIGSGMYHSMNINAKLTQVQWKAPEEELQSAESPTMDAGIASWLDASGPQGMFNKHEGFLGMALVQNSDLERSWLINMYSTPKQRDESWQDGQEAVQSFMSDKTSERHEENMNFDMFFVKTEGEVLGSNPNMKRHGKVE